MREITEETRYQAQRKALDENPTLIQHWLEQAGIAVAASDWMGAASALRSASRLAETTEYAAVNVARYEGATWESIGEKYGSTKQAVQQKFGRPLRETK